MIRKIIHVVAGLALICSPLIASAQTATTSSNTSLIAILTQLVQVLEQELQQLLAAPNAMPAQLTPPTNPTSVSFTAGPISGTAPLSITLNFDHQPSATIDFGDGSSEQALTLSGNGTTDTDGYCSAPPDFGCSVRHTYNAPGTYIAKLDDASGNVLATQTITVISDNSTQPSATINQSSLTTGFPAPTISGAYSNIVGALALAICADNTSLPISSLPNCVFVDHSDHGGSLQTTSTSATSGTFVDNYVPSLAVGTYTIGVYTYKNIYTNNGYQGPAAITLLTTGTLTVDFSSQYFTPNIFVSFIASPTAGATPLDVQFGGSIPGDNGYTINYGDGTQNNLSSITDTCPSPGPCMLPSSMTVNSSHIYQSAGTYTVALTSNGSTLGTAIITVTGSNSSQPSATITSPTAESSGNFSVSGIAQDSSAVIVTLISAGSNGAPYSGGIDWNTIGGYLQGTPYATTTAGNILRSYTAPVTSAHQFSTFFTSISSGVYTVLVHNSDHSQYALLARATLLVASY